MIGRPLSNAHDELVLMFFHIEGIEIDSRSSQQAAEFSTQNGKLARAENTIPSCCEHLTLLVESLISFFREKFLLELALVISHPSFVKWG